MKSKLSTSAFFSGALAMTGALSQAASKAGVIPAGGVKDNVDKWGNAVTLVGLSGLFLTSLKK